MRDRSIHLAVIFSSFCASAFVGIVVACLALPLADVLIGMDSSLSGASVLIVVLSSGLAFGIVGAALRAYRLGRQDANTGAKNG